MWKAMTDSLNLLSDDWVDTVRMMPVSLWWRCLQEQQNELGTAQLTTGTQLLLMDTVLQLQM